MANDNNPKKKIAVIGVTSVLLVAMVIAVAVRRTSDSGDSGPNASHIYTTERAEFLAQSEAVVKDLCTPSLIKPNCEENLAKSAETTSDPKKLVEDGFQLIVDSLQTAMKNYNALKPASANIPRAKRAFEICDEFINIAIHDLNRSKEELQNFDMSKGEVHIDNLKTWIEGTLTHQEVCCDGFKNTTAELAQKVRQIMKDAGVQTCNGLATINGLAILMSIDPKKLEAADSPAASAPAEAASTAASPTAPTRRLLGGGNSSDDSSSTSSSDFPRWVTPRQRRFLQATPATAKPDIVVALDGSGQFKSVGDAVASIDMDHKGPIVMHVKAGVYDEQVLIPEWVTNLMMIGDGPTKTKITGKKNFKEGTATVDTATFAVNAMGFIAKDMGFENTAGPEGFQALAYRSISDFSVLYNCQFDGYQDTIFAQTYRQFFRDCTISGTIDFIFGVARTIFQNCTIIIRKPMPGQACIITAEGRQDPNGNSSIVIQNSRIIADPAYLTVKATTKAYLGRPWKEYSRTVIMHTEIDGIIDPEGWSRWDKDFGINTLYYAEFENKGPGAVQTGRVTWPGIRHITAAEAEGFTPAKLYLEGDQWIKDAGIPYVPGM
ncbi:Putative pectinesterase/pectinesterase inhibitor 28 [Linum grandiflorum]